MIAITSYSDQKARLVLVGVMVVVVAVVVLVVGVLVVVVPGVVVLVRILEIVVVLSCSGGVAVVTTITARRQ